MSKNMTNVTSSLAICVLLIYLWSNSMGNKVQPSSWPQAVSWPLLYYLSGYISNRVQHFFYLWDHRTLFLEPSFVFCSLFSLQHSIGKAALEDDDISLTKLWKKNRWLKILIKLFMLEDTGNYANAHYIVSLKKKILLKDKSNRKETLNLRSKLKNVR